MHVLSLHTSRTNENGLTQTDAQCSGMAPDEKTAEPPRTCVHCALGNKKDAYAAPHSCFVSRNTQTLWARTPPKGYHEQLFLLNHPIVDSQLYLVLLYPTFSRNEIADFILRCSNTAGKPQCRLISTTRLKVYQLIALLDFIKSSWMV